MKTIAAATAKRDFMDLVKGASEGRTSYRILHKNNTAVLLSERDYDALIETLDLLTIPGFRASLKRSIRQEQHGETFSMDDVFGEQA